MSQSGTVEIAGRMLQIIPLVMRVMSAQMRHAPQQGLNSNNTPLLGALKLRTHTLSELAERMSVSAPTMSNTITTLEERGWVLRRRSEEDRRVVWIEITPEGIAALDAMQNEVKMRIAQLLEGLSDEEQATLVNGLTVLRDVFAAALERDPLLRT
jgi:MarR family transcriptional regulator, organic hydroperoxide resistance regulator